MPTGLSLSRSDGIQTIRLDRPDKKNALTLAMYRGMAEAIERSGKDPDTRVVLILGAPGIFTAGNDIQDFAAATDEFGEVIIDFLRALATAPKPLVAGVEGLAIGIGTTLLLHCDLVFAGASATFRTPFVDLGLVPEAASTLLAPRIMGGLRAFELLCAGAPFSAERAREAGLVNAVVPDEQLADTARGAALALAAKPQDALLAARRLLRGPTDEILRRMDEEAAEFKARMRSPEARAAFDAFLGKRHSG